MTMYFIQKQVLYPLISNSKNLFLNKFIKGSKTPYFTISIINFTLKDMFELKYFYFIIVTGHSE